MSKTGTGEPPKANKTKTTLKKVLKKLGAVSGIKAKE